MVAHHSLPGPHDGARVQAVAARGGEARHLPAGRRQLQAAQEAFHRQRVLQPAQPGGDRACRGAEQHLAGGPPDSQRSSVDRSLHVRPHARLPQRTDVDAQAGGVGGGDPRGSASRPAFATVPRISIGSRSGELAARAGVQTDHGRDASRSQEVADQHL
eukprot:5836582-Prymnesium_polylepis.1